MTKIKFLGAAIFILSLLLALIFTHTHTKSLEYKKTIDTLAKQKDFTQEISKNIFYMYQSKEYATDDLNSLVKLFIDNMNSEDEGIEVNKKIVHLWNKFYLFVQTFRDDIKSNSPYSTITLQRCVKDIYDTNQELIVEFDKLIKLKQDVYAKEQNIFKTTQYLLFVILVTLLIYMFFQLRGVIEFIHRFINSSKNIINNSSIKDLKPIEIEQKNIEIKEAQENFNILVSNIDSSIKNYSKSIEYSNELLIVLERDMEELMEFIYEMNESKRDKELIEKEDIVIQSFEELSACTKKLNNLKDDLNNLITTSTKD